MTNETPTIQPWAMTALRELVDIAGLLNDEQFISHEEDPRIAIIDRLTLLIQSLVIDNEPLVDQEDDEGRDYSGFSDDIYFDDPRPPLPY